MRVAPYVLMVCLFCSGTTGCALFGRKSSEGGGGRWWFTSDRDQTKKTLPSQDPLFDASNHAAEVRGVLAGRVLDDKTGMPVPAYIRYECLDEPNPQAAPIDVAVGPQGYFQIYGLKMGKHYKLEARAKQGDRKLAATSYATAPNTKMVINLSEEFVTQQTPPVPPAATLPNSPQTRAGPKENGTQDASKNADPSNQAAFNDNGFGIGSPRTLGDKTRVDGNVQPSQWGDKHAVPNGQRGYPRNIVKTPPAVERPDRLPPPPVVREGDGVPPPPPAAGVALGAVSSAMASVPQLAGKRIVNFALPDFYDRPWEWRSNRRGKLVLMDFWHTSCVYCLQDMTHLRILQEKYSGDGLEILGIACERGGSYADQKYRVIRMCNQKQTKYRMLLNTGPTQNAFLDAFNVPAYPTLILYDEEGLELWRHVGRMSRRDVDHLESLIRVRLGAR